MCGLLKQSPQHDGPVPQRESQVIVGHDFKGLKICGGDNHRVAVTHFEQAAHFHSQLLPG